MKVISKVASVLVFILSLSTLNAQENTLDKHFTDYEIATFDSRSLRNMAEQKRLDFLNIPFQLGENRSWKLELTSDHKVFSEEYVKNAEALRRSGTSATKLPLVLRGYSEKSNNTHATITVNDDFLYGMIKTPDEVIYFEPLSTFNKTAAPDQIIIYKESDVVPGNGTCASETLKAKKHNLTLTDTHEHASTRMPGQCRQVDLAIANDYNVIQARGANTTSWNAGVMANVNTDYDDSFADEVRFVIVQTWLGTSGNSAPWGANADANVLLNNFSDWAPSGFSSAHDMGQLWTETDLTYNGSSSTVGLAWVGNQWGCTGRYHVLEDFGNNANSLRVLVSHEIGHNFSLSHEGGAANIMSSSIQNTTVWAANSVNGLNSYIQQNNVDCLGACNGNPPGGGGGGGTPPDADFNATYISECNPTRLQFNDASTNTPTSWSWTFQNGTPSTSTAQNPQVNFPGAGVYQVALTATNADGSNTQTYNMNLSDIGAPPNASFTSSVSGFTAIFNNNTTGGSTYSWAFGDGQSSTAANPSHAYASAGTYSVTLTSNNDCGTDDFIANVTITDQVAAAFTSNTTEICEGQQVTYTNQSSSNVTTFSWQFENGTPSTSTEENPTVTYNNAGTFNARLTVSGGGTNDTENKANYIDVNDTPNASFTHEVNGYSVAFDNNTTGGSTYNWAFGDGGTSIQAHPTHVYSGPGMYAVTLTSGNDCGSDDYIVNVLIADEVVADFTVNETQGCAADTYVFTSLSTGNISTYAWTFEDGIPATSSEENPTVSFSSPGTKNVTLAVSNAQYNDQESKNNFITILGSPNVNFSFTVTDNTVEFDNNTVGGNTYSWDFGDGNTSIQAHPTHTYDGPGDYTVTLVSANSCETEEIQRIVSIESDIVARFISNTAEICAGETVNFTNTSAGNISSYFWEFEGGSPATSSAENPSVVYNQSGSFNAKLTVSDGVTTDEENKTDFIEVLGAPSAAFTHQVNGYTVTFTNNSTGGNQNEWDFGNGESSTLANPSHTYSAPGSYTVSLITNNACDEAQATLTIEIEEVLTAAYERSTSQVCEGESVSFASVSEGEIQSYFWEFQGGTPATSDAAQPVVNYSVAGSYGVKLTVTSIHGGSDVVNNSNDIVVVDATVADFSYTLNELAATFTNLSEHQNGVVWNFGDGSTSTDNNPTHTYAEEGDYTVTLAANGDCGSDSKEVSIPVFNQLLANFMATETTLCPGEEISLVDLSSGNPTEWEWRIEGEEMISADEQNPVLILDMPGTYNVELTVRNSEEEDSKILQQYIEVMPLPESSFNHSQDELTVSFNNNSVNGDSFFWDFGDGNTSTEANPAHTYAQEGDYVVMLRVVNTCNTQESEQQVGVYNRLVAGFTTSESAVCTGTEIQFQNQSTGNVSSYSWSFPGGTPSASNLENPIVTYSEPGDYDVELTISNDSEEVSEMKTRLINISKAAVADFEFVVDKNEVSFTNTSVNADEILWSFESDEESPVIIYEEETSYEVSLTATNGCSTDVLTKDIDLYAASQTFVNIDIQTSSYCQGDEIQFVDMSSSDITEWNWKFPGGSPAESNEENPLVSYSDLGTYDVELTVSNGFNVRTILLEDYVNVLDNAKAGFLITQENNTINVENTATSFTEVYWYVNDEIVDGDLSQYAFSKNGEYEIKQVVRNACTESEFLETITVDVFPTAGFSLNTTRGCAPLVVNFESKSDENASEVSWIFEGAENEEASGLNPSATYNNPGSYGLTVIATNEFGTDTIVLKDVIEVIQAPEAIFEYEANGTEVDFSAILADFDKVFWDLGDGNTSDELDVNHTYKYDGVYIVTLTVYSGNCVSEFSEEILLFTSSVDDVEELSSFKIFPNPAQSYVDVSFLDIADVEKVSIIDLLGREVESAGVSKGANQIRLGGLESFSAGQYLISLKRTGMQPVYKKLIVIK